MYLLDSRITPYEEFVSPYFRAFSRNFGALSAIIEENQAFSPRFGCSETENTYDFTLELPGFKRSDVEVEVNRENTLRVRAVKGKLILERTLTLGAEVDPEKVEAKLEDGILTVVAAKREIPKPRKITVG